MPSLSSASPLAHYHSLMQNPYEPLNAQDLITVESYTRSRHDFSKLAQKIRQERRLFLGSKATLVFENRFTWWYQIQEMLRIENGGDAQAQEELLTYNAFIPKPRKLVATLMLEFSPLERAQALQDLAGIENALHLAHKPRSTEQMAFSLQSTPLRTLYEKPQPSPAKACSVQFLAFDFDSHPSSSPDAYAFFLQNYRPYTVTFVPKQPSLHVLHGMLSHTTFQALQHDFKAALA